MTNNSAVKKMFLIDVMPLLYRGHFAFLRSPRMTSTGINTSALIGFANTVIHLLQEYEPTHVALVLDPATPTFRHELYPAYKAQREKMPEPLAASIPMVFEFAAAMRLTVVRVDRFEADDVMGTLAHQLAKERDWVTYLVTPDKDIAQLVDENTLLLRPSKNNTPAEVLDVAQVCEQWQLTTPTQMIELLGLAGDASDNIPGIMGVGEKTAQKLLAQYGDIETIIAHADELKGKLAERVREGAENARQSRMLATIRTDVPLDLDLTDLKLTTPATDELRVFLQKYELTTLGKRLLGDDFSLQGAVGAAEERHDLQSVPHEYVIVKNEAQLATLLKALEASNEWAFDTETTGLNPDQDRVVGISFATQAHRAWFVPLPPEFEAAQALLQRFQGFFADPFKVKVGHNIKFDIRFLQQYGVQVRGELRDSMLVHYVLDAAGRHGLEYLARQHLNYHMIPITDLIGTKKRGAPQLNMGELLADEISDYAAEDADITLQLQQKLRAQAHKLGVLPALTTCEEPLIEVLCAMEAEGVKINADELRAYGLELDRELLELDLQIRDLGGGNFNPASPKQLGEVLFDRLGLDANAKRTASGQYNTSEGVLVKLQDRHPIIPLVMEYRACSKLKSTYVDKLPQCISPKTGRVHTSFAQALTETGRLSSSDPNLQNIPIRSERGQRIRHAFVARDEQHVLLSADYSQIELRLMAALSEDEAMLEAFARGADIHSETAMRVYGVGASEVTPEMRSNCKMVNFGIIYGISAFGLSQRLNVPRKTAADLIETYFEKYPGVQAYMERAIAEARDKGYASTILGRRRTLPDINSRNATVRQAAERNAINTPVQGSAADLIKLAMVRVYRQFNEQRFKSRMILQIHDELLFDVPQNELAEVQKVVKNAMETAFKLSVPLEVSMGVGQTWLEAH